MTRCPFTSGAVVLFLLTGTAAAQPPATAATASPDRHKIRLSEPLRVTLRVMGAAPLRVELADPVLAPESHAEWNIQPVGAAQVTVRDGAAAEWVQTFRLDLYVPGSSKTILFAPIRVNGRDIPGPACEVVVEPPSMEARPESAIPVTGVEPVPPAPVPVGGKSRVWWVAGALLAVLAAAAVALRTKRRKKPVPPREWAVDSFAQLERSPVTGIARADSVSAIVRGFIERRFGIPATRLTTQELLAAAMEAGWPVEESDPLRRLLDDCDRAKFAGDIPDDDGCRDLLARGRDWVNLVRPGAGPG